MTINISYLKSWLGRTETLEDIVTPTPVKALAATLDRDDVALRPGDDLLPLWHWLYFLPLSKRSEIGSDGHAKRGGFLPPVTLPRRMWAGSRFRFHQPIRIGDNLQRKSEIIDVSLKEGRTGELVFVTVRHEITNPHGLALSEEHDIVYRDHAALDANSPPRMAPSDAKWKQTIHSDEVLLFRYSALIFNAHRIHYDRHYATDIEGYPGLVVHGPLVATLLADLARRKSSLVMKAFRFRAVHPLFDIADFEICGTSHEGRSFKLWAQNTHGHLAMEAEAELA